jgi:hypothetical protein
VTFDDGLLYPLLKVRVSSGGVTMLEVSPEIAAEQISHHFETVVDHYRSMLRIRMAEKELRWYLDMIFSKTRSCGHGAKYKNPSDRDKAVEECVRLFFAMDVPSQTKGTFWSAYGAVAECRL